MSDETIQKMSPLKKVLIVFVFLLIFIIIVEQPGSDDSKRQKRTKFFIPKLVIENVSKFRISNPLLEGEEVVLEKQEDQWRVANGRLFPADEERINAFLKSLHSLKEDELISKNSDRVAIFQADEANGIHVEIWNEKGLSIADFYAGKVKTFNQQYLRKSDSDQVILSQNIQPQLTQYKDDWKDKTLLEVNESQVNRIALKDHGDELVLEKESSGQWHVVQPEDYIADSLTIRTLFEQLKKVNADSFVDAVEGSQVDFENFNYKISVRFEDDSLKLILFSGPNEEGDYFAKNGERNVIYSVSPELIDNIFDLQFKPEVDTD